jgi:hypothetical protein
MTGTNCDLFTHKSSRSYLNHLVCSLCNCHHMALSVAGKDLLYVAKDTDDFGLLNL